MRLQRLFFHMREVRRGTPDNPETPDSSKGSVSQQRHSLDVADDDMPCIPCNNHRFFYITIP